ncbi:type II toxin-antitoxin system Phd/YefM family antitoxin [Xylocopilactobacillus apis]|uniref:Antitoxin n=1 Tax=Xylocopilactobacillus apis TaxID=2932183 RepID=A0AAU9CPR3_9LACO|nr:type II toxin-antitoxin system Phd/YefM family antitoxin [Xylocopilactobacillus apis]BDR55934.1 hypothetical protein KIMC2_04960 [Xylocopilactobacillus apis]
MTVKKVTLKNLQNNFNIFADEVVQYNDTLIITQPNQKNVVMISESEYDSWQETNYLLNTKANREALKESIEELNNKNVHSFNPD